MRRRLRQGGPVVDFPRARVRGDRDKVWLRWRSWPVGWAGSIHWVHEMPIWCRVDDRRADHGPLWDNSAAFGIGTVVEPERSIGEEVYTAQVEARRRSQWW